MDVIVGIGEFKISNNKEDVLKTFALASCIGLLAHCPVLGVSGLIHIALPDQGISDQALNKPAYYASMGLPLFIDAMKKDFGCIEKDIKVNVFGGADSIHKNDMFNIGKKNLLYVKSFLDAKGLNYTMQDVGGHISRTIEVHPTTGAFKVYTQPIRF